MTKRLALKSNVIRALLSSELLDVQGGKTLKMTCYLTCTEQVSQDIQR